MDDPYTFGQIAAANSVSDVYAMGGTPLTALSIIGFPVRAIPDEAMFEILRGGIDKMKEAGCAIIGGHSINDAEIKAGFAVTGIIDKNRVVTNAAARAGRRADPDQAARAPASWPSPPRSTGPGRRACKRPPRRWPR